MENFLNPLNKAQKEAVKNYKGPSLVIAGAGSGKTKVLTYRIAYILKQGVKPWNILSLTFTNKAATEMKKRIAEMVDEESARKLWMGTFHSIFSRILRLESQATGYSKNYTIYDSVDSKNLVRKIIRELSLDEKVYKPNQVLGRISTAKNNLITSQSYSNNPQIIQQDENSRKPRIADIFRIYSSRCRKADAMDFDDLLLNTNILFRDHPEILRKYQDKFHYILVDEYQDTNFAQYLIVKKLSQKFRNLCVVGDDAQSIYSFRGAKIENILNFQKDFQDAGLYKLEQNYRSTQTIVDAANSMIRKNENQIHKNVFSEQHEGDKIEVLSSFTDTEEAYNIARSISDKINSEGYDYQDFAILYRTNAQSRNFEEAFRRFNLPYKVYGGISFYQRKEIKDMLAYLRLSINFKDEEALLRIINYPARGIGKTTLEKVQKYANKNSLNIWDVLDNLTEHQIDINRNTAEKIRKFTEMIKGFSKLAVEKDAYQAAITIAEKSGIINDLKNPVTLQEQNKFENIQEILNGIKDFTEGYEGEEIPTLEEYIQNVSLLTSADNESKEDINKITIMTMHSAKGLEFKNVYLTGIEEGIFPSRMSMNSDKELEEERRLFYVALTRAEEKAILSYANNRYKWGVSNKSRPSRFIYDIDPKYMNFPDYEPGRNGESEPDDLKSDKLFDSGRNSAKKTRNLKKIGKSPKGNQPQAEYKGELQVGMKVEHDRFGKGKILNIEDGPPNTKATIFFNEHGQKQLLLKYAKLKIIS
ncbi:MAG: exodeoxyribonuclease V subunit gamma [Bacteroidales bacterium]|nr:exodeoxyribonuclease V subunit gamma [Bacteroidales bacterium]